MTPVATVKVFRLTLGHRELLASCVLARLIAAPINGRNWGSVLDGTCHLGPNRPGKPGSLQLAQGRPG